MANEIVFDQEFLLPAGTINYVSGASHEFLTRTRNCEGSEFEVIASVPNDDVPMRLVMRSFELIDGNEVVTEQKEAEFQGVGAPVLFKFGLLRDKVFISLSTRVQSAPMIEFPDMPCTVRVRRVK